MNKSYFKTALLACALCACSSAGAPSGNSAADSPGSSRGVLEPALESLSVDDLMRHVRVLSDDSFGGRSPGTEGGQKTIDYLVEQFRSLGLEPGNPDGTYVQRVPLMGFTTTSTASFSTPKGELQLEPTEDYVAITRLEDAGMRHLDVVFVGYGSVAPEYGWDDFKGVDVRGKAIVILVNDPPIALDDDPQRLDDAMFRGKAMTYYGRWTYKYEIARKMGASAAIIVHETGPAGYPWEVIGGSWGREGFDIAGPEAAAAHVPIESWIQRDVAERLFAASGLDFEEQKRAALSRDFRPIVLPGTTVNLDCNAKIRHIESSNVVALRRGSHPTRKNEFLVLTAHWDHLGIDPSIDGDQIFNGALDNASGTSGILELAEAFTRVEPDRSILFLAVTAEEKGLLGSKYYAANPLYPLERTLANINMDGLNCYGRTRDVVSIGQGFSTLDETLTAAASLQDRRVEPDAEPEKGFYFRSDHFSFVNRGVPALYAESGVDYRDRPSGWGRERRDRYTSDDYHKPSDEIKDDWNMLGGLEDVELYLRIIWALSQQDAWPEWKPGSEFKAVREEMLRKAR
jgi:Zn-dependent M28 family amino/carboxypeptidase